MVRSAGMLQGIVLPLCAFWKPWPMWANSTDNAPSAPRECGDLRLSAWHSLAVSERQGDIHADYGGSAAPIVERLMGQADAPRPSRLCLMCCFEPDASGAGHAGG